MSKRVEVARRRQEVLLPPRQLTYSAFLDEACVRRVIGGPAMTADQLKHLASLLEYPNISIRVLPFTIGAHPGQPGGFCLIALRQSDVSDVVYVDSLAGQLFLETADDLERHRRVLSALDKVALSTMESRAFFVKLENSLREG
jgi:hypothetical protein